MTKKINKDPKPTARTVARRQELAGAVPTAATDKYYIGLLVNERLLQVFADNRKAETVLAESGYDFVSAPFESIASAREELNRLVLRLPSDFEMVKGLMAGGRSIYISKSEFQIVDNELRRLRFARNGKKVKA